MGARGAQDGWSGRQIVNLLFLSFFAVPQLGERCSDKVRGEFAQFLQSKLGFAQDFNV